MLQRIRTFFRGGDTEQKSSLAHPSPELLALFGAVQTAAGQSVTPETALRSPTTLAACRVISEAVGTLPIHLFRRGTDGAKERESDHAAARLLSGDWTPWAGGAEIRTALQMDALLHGAGFAQVVRAGGEPRELHRLDPRSVTVEVDNFTLEPSYRVHPARGADYILGWQDVLYIPTPGSSPDRPICLIQACREAIAIDLTMAEHQGRLFANGARPSGILKYDKQVSPELMERLKRSFDSAHSGGANSGKTLILEDGMEFDPQQFNSVDLQFLELRRFAIQEIGRGLRVPSALINDLERATWNNVTELGQQFRTYTLLPWLEVWEAALSRVLLRPEERDSLFLEFLPDALIKADLASRFAAYRNAVGGSWLTANEVRALDNRPPVEGGDVLLRQAGQSDSGAEDTEDENDGQ